MISDLRAPEHVTRLLSWPRCARPAAATKSRTSCALLAEKRRELARRVAEMRFLDQRMAHLASQLEAGGTPRTLINLGKEDEHAPAL